jgi:hypothetical protein
VCAAATAYLLWDGFVIQFNYWASQPAGAGGLSLAQTCIGVIGFVIIPALTVAVATSGELVELIRMAHLVRRVELMMLSDIAITRGVLLRAAHMAERGYENLSPAEQASYRGVLAWLVESMDANLAELGESYALATGERNPRFSRALASSPTVVDYVRQAEHVLTHGSLTGYAPLADGPAAPPGPPQPRLGAGDDPPLSAADYAFLEDAPADQPPQADPTLDAPPPDATAHPAGPRAPGRPAPATTRRRRPPPRRIE